MTVRDWQQDEQLAELEKDANDTVEAFGTLAQQVHAEKKRNDVQSARIRALAEVIETMLQMLKTNGALPEAQASALLGVLRDAMAPVKK